MSEYMKHNPAQEFAAKLVSSKAKTEHEKLHEKLTVPRSHRFGLELHDRILALAEGGGVPFSVMLEHVIACGLYNYECELGAEFLEKIEYRRVRSMNISFKGRTKVVDLHKSATP